MEGALIPVAPLVWIVVALVRRVSRTSGPRRPPDPRQRNLVLRIALTSVLVFLVFTFAFESRAFGWGMLALLVPVVFPATFAARVLVPLGLARAAYTLIRLSPPPFYFLERRGAAVFFGALAALRARRLSPGTLTFLEGRLLLEPSARAATLAAAGLLAALRGKREAARLLLVLAEELPVHRLARAPIEVARTWLLADAARRGRWHEVAELGRRYGSYQRWPHAMSLIAERVARSPGARSDAWLVVAWLVAPHRRATWPILRRALSTDRAPRSAPETRPVTAPEEVTLEHAVRVHAECLRAPTPSRVVESALAWDAVTATPRSEALERRAGVLCARTGAASALARLADAVVADLAPLVDGVDGAVAQASDILRRAGAQAFRTAEGEIKLAVEALRDRTERQTSLETHAEWLAWASLRTTWQRATRGASLADRRALFAAAEPHTCNYAVWLFNARIERLLAGEVFQSLLVEAQLVGDLAAVRLLTRNVEVSRSV